MKLIVLFFLAGIIWLGRVGYCGVKLYRMNSGETEYVLTAPETAGAPDISRKFRKLQEEVKLGTSEGLESADLRKMSLQQRKNIILHYQGQEVSVSCAAVSGDYLESVYGITKQESMQTLYLNQKAWDSFRTEKEELVVDSIEEKQTEEEGGLNKTVKLVKLPKETREESPLILSRKEDISLEKRADSIRVCLKNGGAEGRQAKALKKQGFDFENQEEVLIEEQQKGLWQVRMKYETALSGVCFLFGGILWKYGKDKRTRFG